MSLTRAHTHHHTHQPSHNVIDRRWKRRVSCAGQEVTLRETKESKDVLFLMFCWTRQSHRNCLCVRRALWELYIFFSCFAMLPPQSPNQTIPAFVQSGDALVAFTTLTHSPGVKVYKVSVPRSHISISANCSFGLLEERLVSLMVDCKNSVSGIFLAAVACWASGPGFL